MIVEHRLRKFDTVEMDGEPVNRMLWVKWFRTDALAREFADVDSGTDVVWIGDSGLTELNVYDVKRFEVAV